MSDRRAFCILVTAGLLAGRTLGEDWPQWRYDAGHSAASPEKLPATLHLHWVCDYGPRTQVWDDPLNHDLMPYDKTFEPVVLGERLFVNFNDADKVVALDIRSGRELWTFYTDGPVRLPAAAWDNKVYFASDDGHLYCVGAEDGALLWKVPGGPSARKVVGNRRVISAWPARGGPVVREGRVYFAASIWPFMGIFIYAVDAKTGEVVWVNDGTGAQYLKQPHAAPGFAGVAPQGTLVATKDMLLVPGGRSVPAGFDRHTGKFLWFHLDEGGKGNGGSFVIANESEFFVHTRDRGVCSFDLKSGKKGKFTISQPVLAEDILYAAERQGREQRAVLKAEDDLAWARMEEMFGQNQVLDAILEESESQTKKAQTELEKLQKKTLQAEVALEQARKALPAEPQGGVIRAIGTDRMGRWELPADGYGDIILAGDRLYAAGTNRVFAVGLPQGGDTNAEVAWSHPVAGRVQRLLAANGMLFAVTLEGQILGFGEENKPPTKRVPAHSRPWRGATNVVAQAVAVLQRARAEQGYALCYGLGDGELLKALVARSKLHVVGVDPDPEKVARLRREFDTASLYGSRVTLHAGDPVRFQAPPYLANLVVVGDPCAGRLTETGWLKAVYESVRPYGGALWIAAAGEPALALSKFITHAELAQARVEPAEGGRIVFREGALPGGADWTHQYGNIGNTVKSDDKLVKAPLGLLWFGGLSNMDVLPRHGHGPPEQVVGGRLFIQGLTSLSARDVYTGRLLWKRDLPGLDTFGLYYNETYTNTPLSIAYNQKHIPGANARGANYVVTEDLVYLALSNQCQVLEARTGNDIRRIELAPEKPGNEPPQWGFIGVYQDVLLAGTGFAHFRRQYGVTTNEFRASIEDYSASAGLAGFDRHTGKLLWQVPARYSFLHNGIVAGQGRVYCLDRLPKSAEAKRKRRGLTPPADYRIVALDSRTGRWLWEVTEKIFGTWLGYSERHGLLLQAGASGRDRLGDEAGQGMSVHRGQDGSVQWLNKELKYTGPCILYHDLIIAGIEAYKMSAGAFHLTDGSPYMITNPLTGLTEPWRISRAYGCNTVIASENLLTFRSGAAGYYDLTTQSGTASLGGFKSGCTANLIAANGVLNAPDYTRTCTCAYQNQTSLGLVHMPEMELWTYSYFGAETEGGERVVRAGLNFGAPGDRRSEDGTLWVDYPSVGGDSPSLPVDVKGEDVSYYRRHSALFRGQGLAWVIASGLRGATSITVTPTFVPPTKPVKVKSAEDKEEEEKERGSAVGNDTNSSNGLTVQDAHAVRAQPTAVPSYTVLLYFAEPDDLQPGERVFGISLQGKRVLEKFDIASEAAGVRAGVVREFKGIAVGKELILEFHRAPESKGEPIISGIELVAEQPPPKDT